MAEVESTRGSTPKTSGFSPRGVFALVVYLVSRCRAVSLQVLGLVFAVVIWWAFSLALPPSFEGFSPIASFQKLISISSTDYFLDGVATTIGRLFMGLSLAALVGALLGLIIAKVKTIHDLTYLVFQLLRMISPLAWMPIAILVFGTGTEAVVFLVSVAAVWPMMINTAQAVGLISPRWIEVAKTYGGGRLDIFKRVILPAIMPQVLSGLRVALGIAWVVIVPAEMIGVSSGLGYMILDFRDVVDYSGVAATILTISVLGYVMDQGICLLIKKVQWT